MLKYSPAKINLFLHILGKRADGYHELQTAFQFIDFSDTLEFTLRPDGKITRDDNSPRFGANDLILKAANLLKQYSGSSSGASVRLNKKLPIGGGLGGGSSNAATTLVALNELWQTGFKPGELLKLGLKLGADVPIFIHGKAAWAEGVGEEISDYEFSEMPTLVVCPKVAVITSELFQAKQLTRDTPRMKIPSPLDSRFRNDFTQLVCDRYPEVKEVMDFLQEFSKPKITGSGGCVFAQFAKMSKAREVLTIIPPKWNAFARQSLNNSPLYL